MFRIKFIKLLLIPLFITFSKIIPQDHWFLLDSPTDNFLRTLQFTDSLTGWVAGDSGLVLHTTNGGGSWMAQQTNTTINIIDLFFLDENRGWALALEEVVPPLGTTILKTTNGGEQWEAELYSNEDLMSTIYFLDTLNGFMGGNWPRAFVRTTDGGNTWFEVNIDSLPLANFPVVNIKFYNDLYGFAVGGAKDIAGVVWKTKDGGNLWTPIDPNDAPADEIWDIHFLDSLNLICAGGDPESYGVGFLYSSDAGNSWRFNEIGYSGVARAIEFRTGYEGWAPVPLSLSLLYSLDSGYTWTAIPSPGNSAIYDMAFTDSLTGYGVGDNGAIIKYKYPVVPSAMQDLTLSQNIILYQNYPNPFNPETQISFSLPEESFIELELYDVKGERIMTIEKGIKSTGFYQYQFHLGNLSSGIYLYRLIVSTTRNAGRTITLSRKMILMR